MSEPIKGKKRRGRPRLSEEEKARRKAQREKNKKIQKNRTSRARTARKKTAEKLVKEELENKADSSIELLGKNFTESEKVLLEPTTSITSITDIENERENLTGYWQDQTDRITEKINNLEIEMITLLDQLKTLKTQQSKLVNERLLTKNLIREEQDLLWNYEI